MVTVVETDRRRLVAERIAEARQTAALSKGALAGQVGIRLWLIDRIEAGIATPPEELIERIAEATGRSSAWLRGEDEGQSAPTRIAAATTRRPAEGTEPGPAVDRPELLRLAAELVALAAERDRLAAELSQVHAAAAAREAAAAAHAAELTAHAAELVVREVELATRECELAELAADQADIGRALIRREIRLELDESTVEAESFARGTAAKPTRSLRPARSAVPASR